MTPASPARALEPESEGPAAAGGTACYHCGLPVPSGVDLGVEIDGVDRPMCCHGCQAVARAIVANGLTDYYRYRTETTGVARELVPEALRELELYDRPELQRDFVRASEDGGERREAMLILEGIVCAACVWLTERHVAALPGVGSFQVNYSTHRARVVWDPERTQLSEILKAVAAIGYIAHPYDPGRQEEVQRRERRAALRRIAVAGLGAMQVMMLAVALYAGAGEYGDSALGQFLRWVSWLLATPVVLYSARPFFQGAWRDLRRLGLGMDVPVALAVGLAYLASTWATLRGSGEIYFDSVTMFTFFLLSGRYLEMNARHQAGRAVEEVMRLLPATTTRVTAAGVEERIAVAELAAGERVRVRPGETLPADGRVIEGRGSVDESILTGESLPRACGPGDQVIGGAINAGSPLLIEVEQVGEDTVLAGMTRLLERAQSEKPHIARLADRVAGWFVGALLLIAAGVAWYWWRHDPAAAFHIVLSVLVVTCPCALSLATPVALTAATGALTRLGVLTTRGHALETLARASHIIFDKTGTLTEGRLRLAEVEPLAAAGDLDEAGLLRLAAALETGSEHPYALAIVHAAPADLPAVGAVDYQAGEGVGGTLDGAGHRLGRWGYACPGAGPEPESGGRLGSPVYLAREGRPLARLWLRDRVREDAPAALEALHGLGLTPALISGDAEAPVAAVADALGIEARRARALPEDKLAEVRGLQRQGAVVAMVGDGVNDAPVLAGAQVSIAMGGGTHIAAAAADLVLLSDRIGRLVDAVRLSRRSLTVIRQNLGWAVIYNLVALPLAAAGWVAPWMAALGMSASSLLVVLNALRLHAPARPRANRTAAEVAGPAPASQG